MKVIAIDFDNTIYFGNDWVDANTKLYVKKLMDKPNNFIVIHTARRKDQRAFIENFLETNGIPYHALVMEKMRADVYIDDKNQGGLQWPKIEK